MKLILQITAAILLAGLIKWLFVATFISPFADIRAIRNVTQQPQTQHYTAPNYDSKNPCAHLEYGSSVRQWCEEKNK